METAFNAAIKAYIRSKNDEAAAQIEKEMLSFHGDNWPHLEFGNVKFTGETFQMGKSTSVFTKEAFSGPIEVSAIARTEKDNIRLRAYRGSCVIFNWEGSPGQLRVARPDGQDRVETGSIAAAIDHPLKPGTSYKLVWRISDMGMQVPVDDSVVWSEKQNYALNTMSKIEIRSENSLVEVRDFHVIPLTKE